jgi:hypothetical protein
MSEEDSANKTSQAVARFPCGHCCLEEEEEEEEEEEVVVVVVECPDKGGPIDTVENRWNWPPEISDGVVAIWKMEFMMIQIAIDKGLCLYVSPFLTL